MKYLLVLIILCSLGVQNSFEQQTTWDWVQQYTTDNVNMKLETQSDNSVICSGVFETSLNIFGHSYSSFAGCDVFLAAINENGSYKWLKRNMYSDTVFVQSGRTVFGLHVLSSDRIVVAGNFQHRIEFDSISVYEHHSSIGGYPIFLYWFDANGNTIKGNAITCKEDLFNTSSAIDNNSNVYICAQYFDTAFVGNIDTLAPQMSSFSAVSIYNSNGDYMHSYGLNSANSFQVERITCDTDGNLYMCGFATGIVHLDNGESFGTATFHYFISKISPTGHLLAYDEISLTGSTLRIRDLKVFDNKLYLGGEFNEVEFTYRGQNFTYADSSYNLFLAATNLMLDSLSFNMNSGQGEIVKIDGNNNGYVFVAYHDINLYNSFFIPMPYNKIYYAKLNAVGDVLWNISSSTPHIFNNMSTLYDMTINSSGSMFASGNFISQIQFGSTVLNEISGVANGFFIKIAQNANIEVHGHVFNGAIPVQNCYVYPFRYGGNSETLALDTLLTGIDGSFTFNTQLPGQYYFKADPQLCGPGLSQAYPLNSANWYNSQSYELFSDTVVTTDIYLNNPFIPTGSQSVQGIITDVFGNPKQNVIVNLTNQNSLVAFSTITDVNGIFNFDNIADSAYRVMIDVPFLPMLNSYITNSYSGTFGYIVTENFIDTGNTYLPAPQDTLFYNLYTCEIDSTIPIDSAFASVAYYSGNDIYVYLQVYQNQVLYDTLLTIAYQNTGINVLMIDFICDGTFKLAGGNDLVFYLDLNPLLNVEAENIGKMGIYPNPAKDNITIFVTENRQIESCEIYSVSGKSVYKSGQIFSSSESISVGNLTPGLYCVKIITSDQHSFSRNILIVK